MNRRILFFTAIFIIVISFSCRKPASYKVYALKFREFGLQPAIGSFAGATTADSVDVCYMIWFLRGNNGRNILVDAGDADSASGGNFIMPQAVLKDNTYQTEPVSVSELR